MGGPRNCLQFWFISVFIIFSFPVAATINLIVSNDRSKWFTTNENNYMIEPIRDTIQPSVVAAGIEQMKSAQSKPYSWAGDGSVDLSCKFDEQTL